MAGYVKLTLFKWGSNLPNIVSTMVSKYYFISSRNNMDCELEILHIIKVNASIIWILTTYYFQTFNAERICTLVQVTNMLSICLDTFRGVTSQCDLAHYVECSQCDLAHYVECSQCDLAHYVECSQCDLAHGWNFGFILFYSFAVTRQGGEVD